MKKQTKRAVRKKIWQEALANRNKPRKPKKPLIPHEPQISFEVEDSYVAARIARFLINELDMKDTVSWWGPTVLVKEEGLTDRLRARIERVVYAASSLYRLLKKRKTK